MSNQTTYIHDVISVKTTLTTEALKALTESSLRKEYYKLTIEIEDKYGSKLKVNLFSEMKPSLTEIKFDINSYKKEN